MNKLARLIILLSILFSCNSGKNIFNKRKYTPGVYRSTSSNYKSNSKKPKKSHFISKKKESEKVISKKEAIISDNNQKSSDKNRLSIGRGYNEKTENKLSSSNQNHENLKIPREFNQTNYPVRKDFLDENILSDTNSKKDLSLLWISLALIIGGILFIVFVAIDVVSLGSLGVLIALLGFLGVIAGLITLIIFLIRLF